MGVWRESIKASAAGSTSLNSSHSAANVPATVVCFVSEPLQCIRYDGLKRFDAVVDSQ